MARENTTRQRENWKKYECRPELMTSISFGPGRVNVCRETVDAWRALEKVLNFHNYRMRAKELGGYNCRAITGGKGKSLHSYGIAVDVNSRTNPYRETPDGRATRFSDKPTQDERGEDVVRSRADTDMTPDMIEDVRAIRTVKGVRVFEWGGGWNSIKDAMHFELDCTRDELAAGVDWSTVAGHAGAPGRDGDGDGLPDTWEERDHPHHEPDGYHPPLPYYDPPGRGSYAPRHESGIRLPDFSNAFPNANAAVLAALRDAGAATLARYGILKTERRFAYFLAQVAHESGGLRVMNEKLDYRAERIVQVFGGRIPTLAMAQAYAHNPTALANRIYGGRMGNGPESSGDGYRYRGRGLIQLTGRENYRNVGKITGLPLESNPDLASDPHHVWEAACGYWKMRNLNACCDAGDFRRLTKLINGGVNGLADREANLQRVQQVLRQTGFVPVGEDAVIVGGGGSDDMSHTPGGGSADDLAYGSKGYQVEALQKRLNELHYYVGKEDGIFGKYTQQGLLAFQAEHGLDRSGVYDAATRALLVAATPRDPEGQRPSVEEGGLIDQSRIVYDSSWTRLLGKISAGLGGLGLFNSGVMNSVSPGVTPETLTQAQRIADAVKAFKPGDPATAQPLLDVARTVLEQKAPGTGAVAQNVFDLLARNASGSNVGGIAEFLGKAAGTLLPGAGGSLVTLGIGIASWLISNRVISSRIADHRAGKHLGR